MADTNALTDILGAGLQIGTAYANQEIYGSTPASNQQLAQEKGMYNSINGSGAVNQKAALDAPMSWTDLFYGPPASTNSTNQPRKLSLVAKVVIALVIGLVIWGIVRVFKKG